MSTRRHTVESARRAIPALEKLERDWTDRLEDACEDEDEARAVEAEKRLDEIEDALSFARDVAVRGEAGRVYERVTP